MKALYKFHWNYGRSGDIHGLFVADKDKVQASMGKKVDFGEILGKHSEVYGTLDDDDLTIKSEDQEFIAKLVDVTGSETISGYNPLEYLQDEDEDD